jgi:hypothetical protein
VPWINGAELAEYLGHDYAAMDPDEAGRFDDRAQAAADWVYARRSRYSRYAADDPVIVPSSQVREGR